MASMDDDDMTVEEFDRLMAEATPVDVVVALNRPKSLWTTSVSHGGGWALGLQRLVKIQQGQLNATPSHL
jgi:hypothetical protein